MVRKESSDQRPSKRIKTENGDREAMPQSPQDGVDSLVEHSEFEILQGYREVDKNVSKDRVEIARNGGKSIALDRLKAVDNLFNKAAAIDTNRNSLLAEDSRAVLNVSELTELSVRNLKLDSSQHALYADDVLNYSKRFMLKDYFQINDLSEQPTDLRTQDLEDTQNSLGQDANLAGSGHEIAQRRLQRGFLKQFEQYDQFMQFDWFKLGMLYQTKSRAPAIVDHLLGPFAAEKKVRAPSQRRRITEAVGKAVTAQRVTKESLNSTEDKTTPEQVKKCFEVLTKKNGYGKIGLFKFIIDPNSFARSVENLFYTSFLIKEGKVILEEDSDGYPAIRPKEKLPKDGHQRDLEIQRRNDARQNHLIFQLDMSTWRKLIKEFDIVQSFIP
ncbi:LANO_0G09208g1_1 [Lachancea nothofagi CBS 11611]|uniref:Non-structural maintenance of chromosomes element 4 n=1 Tax=Lachancea nothofagi CBS 11611 TaxID=1266666 RepID=A0A1G4KIE4_9SACH|nr:LANO_0G09208g1_1 [Lachancea nothofagi CBS 11611]